MQHRYVVTSLKRSRKASHKLKNSNARFSTSQTQHHALKHYITRNSNKRSQSQVQIWNLKPKSEHPSMKNTFTTSYLRSSQLVQANWPALHSNDLTHYIQMRDFIANATETTRNAAETKIEIPSITLKNPLIEQFPTNPKRCTHSNTTPLLTIPYLVELVQSRWGSIGIPSRQPHAIPPFVVPHRAVAHPQHRHCHGSNATKARGTRGHTPQEQNPQGRIKRGEREMVSSRIAGPTLLQPSFHFGTVHSPHRMRIRIRTPLWPLRLPFTVTQPNGRVLVH